MVTLANWLRTQPTHGDKLQAVENIKGFTPVTFMAVKNNPQSLLALLHGHSRDEKLLILNSSDQYGNTVLHYFAHHDNMEVVRTLLRFGVVSVCNNASQYPEDVAEEGLELRM